MVHETDNETTRGAGSLNEPVILDDYPQAQPADWPFNRACERFCFAILIPLIFIVYVVGLLVPAWRWI